MLRDYYYFRELFQEYPVSFSVINYTEPSLQVPINECIVVRELRGYELSNSK
jgi:hypothetical protein